MQNGASQDVRPGRLRAAWHVLMGQRTTPQQIQADWVEYQQIFNDLLDRWSAKLARDAKAEKERIKRLDVPSASPIVLESTGDHKTELRRKLATMRGMGIASPMPKPPEVKHEPDAQDSARKHA